MYAFTCTTVIFASFSGSALLSQRRAYLYLGGILGSAVSMLLWSSLANLFLRSARLAMAEVYLGLLVFGAFILYDTQLMVERASQGDRDVIRHALELFIDAVAVFVRVALILMRNKQDRERQRSRSRDTQSKRR